MDFPLTDLRDEDTCYAKLVAWLHPEGLACSCCHTDDRMMAHRLRRAPIWNLARKAELAGAIDVGASGLVRLILGVRNQAVGVLRGQGLHEVGAANFQNAIDETSQFARGRQRQMTSEDDAVKPREHSAAVARASPGKRPNSSLRWRYSPRSTSGRPSTSWPAESAELRGRCRGQVWNGRYG